MEVYSETLEFETKNEFEFIDITSRIKEVFKKSGIKEGLIIIFSLHTTLAIKINEFEALLVKDFFKFLEMLTPKDKEYFHDRLELRKEISVNEPKNARGHIKNLILETSQTIPIFDSTISLGKWQSVFVVETSGPRKRKILVQVCGEK